MQIRRHRCLYTYCQMQLIHILCRNISSLGLRSSMHSRYIASLRYTDASLGKLQSQLQAMGLASRTLFVISGDHGEAFGAAGGHHANNFLHKNHVYEENIGSFLLLHGPALQSKMRSALEYRISNRVSRVIDVFPTVSCFISGDFSREPKMLFRSVEAATNTSSPMVPFSPVKILCQKLVSTSGIFHHMGHPEWGLI